MVVVQLQCNKIHRSTNTDKKYLYRASVIYFLSLWKHNNAQIFAIIFIIMVHIFNILTFLCLKHLQILFHDLSSTFQIHNFWESKSAAACSTSNVESLCQLVLLLCFAALCFPDDGSEVTYRQNAKEVSDMLRAKHDNNYAVSFKESGCDQLSGANITS